MDNFFISCKLIQKGSIRKNRIWFRYIIIVDLEIQGESHAESE